MQLIQNVKSNGVLMVISAKVAKILPVSIVAVLEGAVVLVFFGAYFNKENKIMLD